MATAMATISDTIRAAIRASGKTGAQLARESGVSEATLSRFMGTPSKKLYGDSADALAEYFGLELQPKAKPSKARAKKTARRKAGG